MLKKSFMFSVEMLADMTGGNKQYLSKKVKEMVEDPQIELQAILKSKKEGYQIPEEEVLRCFHKITPRQVQEYKERYLEMESTPKVRMLTRKEEEKGAKYMEDESEALFEWKVRLAAAAPDKKNSAEMRAYLGNEIEKIRELKDKKMKEREIKIKETLRLEFFIDNCDKMLREIQERLYPEGMGNSPAYIDEEEEENR